jgi:16S rRNA C967 or C1407 C5-methylase (RsmB/RsmF family)
MATEINWQTGTPQTENLYLVAIKLGENSGYYAFSYWNGEQWSQTYPENVIAFFPANQLIRHIDIKWPEPDVVEDPADLAPQELGIENYEEYVPERPA